MLSTLKYLKNRLLESTTWLGMGLAFGGGAAFIPKLIIGTVVCGVIAVLMPDYKGQPNVEQHP